MELEGQGGLLGWGAMQVVKRSPRPPQHLGGSLGCDDPQIFQAAQLPLHGPPVPVPSFQPFLEPFCSPPHLWLCDSERPWMSFFPLIFNFSCFVSFLRNMLHYVEIGC